MVVGGIVVAAAVGGLWSWLGDSGYRRCAAISLMVIAGVLAVSGGTALSRASTNEVRAFLGWGPDTEEPDSGDGLTAMGVFLLVSIPLLVIGLVLFGSG